MEDLVLTVRVSIPKDVLVQLTDEQIKQYIESQLSSAVEDAIREKIDKATKQLMLGRGIKEPVGILQSR